MQTEVWVLVVENRKLQGINDTADSVYDASAQKKGKGAGRNTFNELREGKQTAPAHGDINDCGYPFRTVNEEQTLENADKGDAPHEAE